MVKLVMKNENEEKLGEGSRLKGHNFISTSGGGICLPNALVPMNTVCGYPGHLSTHIGILFPCDITPEI